MKSKNFKFMRHRMKLTDFSQGCFFDFLVSFIGLQDIPQNTHVQ